MEGVVISKDLGEMVLQIPVRLLREVVAIQPDPSRENEGEDVHDPLFHDPLFTAAMPWAVLYRGTDAFLRVNGFWEKEKLSDCVSDLYRAAEIVAVLHNGRPVKFDMRVKARIG